MSTTTPSESLDRFIALWQAGRLADAVDGISQFLDDSPSDASAWKLLGQIRFAQRDFTHAAQAFETALRHTSVPDFDTLLNWGAALASLGDLRKALFPFESATRIAPDSVHAHRYLGQAHYTLGQWREAINPFTTTLKLAPNQADIYLMLSNCYSNLRKHVEAEDCLHTLISFQASWPEAWLALGNVQLTQKKPVEALNSYGQAITLEPGDFRPHHATARALITLGQHRQAIVPLQTASYLAPGNKELLLELGACWFECGEHEKATNFYRQSQSLPENNTTSLQLAVKLGIDNATAAPGVKIQLLGSVIASPLGNIQPFLLHCQDSKILGGEWLPLIPADMLFTQQMAQAPDSLLRKSQFARFVSKTHVLLELPHAHRSIDTGLLIGGSTNYYHWLIDFLPRFYLLEKAGIAIKNYPIIVNSGLTRFQMETLGLLGIRQEQLIEVNVGEVLAVGKLVVPAILSTNTFVAQAVLDWLRIFGLSHLPKECTSHKRRLFISRADATVRRLINEDEVYNSLEPLGFERFVPGAYSFIEQVGAFSNAECIVGPHGAGLTNLVFAPPNALIIDIKNTFSAAQFFETLAGQLGLNYTPLVGEAIMTDASRKKHDRDMRIEPRLVIEALRSYL